MEEIIANHPDIIEESLTLIGRQVSIGRLRCDLLLKDKFGDYLLIEMKKGNLSRQHVGQIMEYCGTLYEGKPLRLMLVSNRVPPSFRKSLEYHGIEWREISEEQFIQYLREKNKPLLEKLGKEKPSQITYPTQMPIFPKPWRR